jgi:hypothetical protein
MKVTVCIGSSCHLKGSRQIVEQLQSLIAGAGLFCPGFWGGGFTLRGNTAQKRAALMICENRETILTF